MMMIHDDGDGDDDNDDDVDIDTWFTEVDSTLEEFIMLYKRGTGDAIVADVMVI